MTISLQNFVELCTYIVSDVFKSVETQRNLYFFIQGNSAF